MFKNKANKRQLANRTFSGCLFMLAIVQSLVTNYVGPFHIISSLVYVTAGILIFNSKKNFIV